MARLPVKAARRTRIDPDIIAEALARPRLPERVPVSDVAQRAGRLAWNRETVRERSAAARRRETERWIADLMRDDS